MRRTERAPLNTCPLPGTILYSGTILYY